MLNAANVKARQVLLEASAPQSVSFLEVFAVDRIVEVVLRFLPYVGA